MRGEHPVRPADGVPASSGAPPPPARWTRRQLLLTAGVGLAGAAVAADLILQDRGIAGVATAQPLYSRCSFGAYADNSPYPDVDAHYALEAEVGAKLKRMSWFQDFGAPWLRTQAEAAAATGHDLCISWQPSADGKPIPFADILTGRYDELLGNFLIAAAAYPHRVIMRPFWEMNAAVATYSVAYTGPDRQVESVEQFRQVWQYLVRLQRQIGGPRVSWFFCANGTDVGADTMEQYWPGSDFVDEYGFDTYNDDRGPWATFYKKVAPMYARFMNLSTLLPLTLGEIGCREDGAPPGESKSLWSQDMFLNSAFPRLTHISLFNAKKGSDWRLNSSPATLETYRQYLPMTKV